MPLYLIQIHGKTYLKIPFTFLDMSKISWSLASFALRDAKIINFFQAKYYANNNKSKVNIAACKAIILLQRIIVYALELQLKLHTKNNFCFCFKEHLGHAHHQP